MKCIEDGCYADAMAGSNYCGRHKRSRLVAGLQASTGLGGVGGIIGTLIGGVADATKKASDKDDADKK